MDAKQFLAEFGHIANAPGGVQRLREMVYNFAVTGNLTDQNEGGENANDLLKEITKEKNTRVNSKNFKRSPKFESLSINKPANIQLPLHWVWTNLVSVGEISPKNVAKDELDTSFIPMSGISQLHSAGLATEQRKWGEIKKGYTQFADGDVVIAKITPCFENGKSAVIENLNNGIGAGTTELHVVRPLPGVNPRYIYIFLRSPYFMIEGELSMTGTAGQKRLTSEYFASRPFPLPPFEEQARIVAKVDELMALCDQLEEQQQQKRELQNQLRKTTIQAVAEATSPFELKQQWQRFEDNFEQLFSTPEDINELRDLVLDFVITGKLHKKSTRADKKNVIEVIEKLKSTKTGKRFAKVTSVEGPFDIPSGWKWVLLEDLLSSSEAGWSPKCHSEVRQKDQWGVLKVSAVTWGEYMPDENKALPLSLEARPETEVQPGDFLLSRANTAELVARSVIVPKNTPAKLMMSDKIVRFKFLDERFKAWVNLANNSTYARAYYYQRATGTSDSMRNVSRQVMHELPIPLPSIDQQRYAFKVMESIIDLCDFFESKLSERNKISGDLAIAAIAILTGVNTPREETTLKTPKTKLFAPIGLGPNKPNSRDVAPLATLLSRQKSTMNAKDLWQRFGGEIDAFYAQLKTEVAHGWLAEPKDAEMLEANAS